jgi:hypothetical protein
VTDALVDAFEDRSTARGVVGTSVAAATAGQLEIHPAYTSRESDESGAPAKECLAVTTLLSGSNQLGVTQPAAV